MLGSWGLTNLRGHVILSLVAGDAKLMSNEVFYLPTPNTIVTKGPTATRTSLRDWRLLRGNVAVGLFDSSLERGERCTNNMTS